MYSSRRKFVSLDFCRKWTLDGEKNIFIEHNFVQFVHKTKYFQRGHTCFMYTAEMETRVT